MPAARAKVDVIGGRILPATFVIYCDWIRGDMLQRGKQERFLAEILGSVIRRYGSQVTWRSLAANPPPFEKLIGDLTGAVSRRINIQHRLVYQVLERERVVKVLRMWTHYE